MPSKIHYSHEPFRQGDYLFLKSPSHILLTSTGEIVEGRELTLDTEKITEEEKYDGYYSVVTSELNMSDYEIRDTYRGLARIEETFKISKTEFESRLVFVWTNEHIPVRLL